MGESLDTWAGIARYGNTKADHERSKEHNYDCRDEIRK
jgi:hypothetical protein